MINTLILLGILTFSFFLQSKKRLMPLHHDTGQNVYRAFFQAKGEKFAPLKIETPMVTLIKNLFSPFRRFNLDTTSEDFDYKPLLQEIAVKEMFRPFFRISPDAKRIRIFFAFYNTVTTFLIFLIGKTFLGYQAACLAAFFYAIYMAIPYTDSGQVHPEHYSMLPLMLSFYLIIHGTLNHINLMLVMGGALLITIVLFYKITFVLDMLAFSLFPLIYKADLISTALIYLGMLLSFIFFLIFFFQKGILKNFLAMLDISAFLHYKKTIPTAHGKESIDPTDNISVRIKIYLPFLYQISLVGFLTLVFFYYAFFSDLNTPTQLFFMIWFSSSSAAIIIQNKYFFSHIVPLIPSVSLMSGFSLWHLLGRMKGSLASGDITYPFLIGSVITFLIILSVKSTYRYLFKYNPLEYQLNLYKSLKHQHTLRFAAAEVIALFIKKNSTPKDRILQWGYSMETYILAQRRAAIGRNEDALACDPLQYDSFWGVTWREAIIKGVKRWRPKFVLDMHGSLNIGVLNKTTGLTYKLEKIFYAMFPLYRLDTLNSNESMDISPWDLTNPYHFRNVNGNSVPLPVFIDHVTSLFVNHREEEADALVAGGIKKIIGDWNRLNGLKLCISSFSH